MMILTQLNKAQKVIEIGLCGLLNQYAKTEFRKRIPTTPHDWYVLSGKLVIGDNNYFAISKYIVNENVALEYGV